MPLIDHFGWIAPFYDRVIKVSESDRLNRLMNFPDYGYLLDAAGGTGRVAATLLNFSGRLIVVDESIKMLTEAKGKNGLMLSGGHTERLPFARGIFDRIIMIDALHHVEDQQRTVSELWRVLRPGGRVIIQELDLRRISVRLVAVLEKLALMRSHFLSAEAIVDLIAQAAAENESPSPKFQIEREGHNVWIIADKL